MRECTIKISNEDTAVIHCCSTTKKRGDSDAHRERFCDCQMKNSSYSFSNIRPQHWCIPLSQSSGLGRPHNIEFATPVIEDGRSWNQEPLLVWGPCPRYAVIDLPSQGTKSRTCSNRPGLLPQATSGTAGGHFAIG